MDSEVCPGSAAWGLLFILLALSGLTISTTMLVYTNVTARKVKTRRELPSHSHQEIQRQDEELQNEFKYLLDKIQENSLPIHLVSLP